MNTSASCEAIFGDSEGQATKKPLQRSKRNASKASQKSCENAKRKQPARDRVQLGGPSNKSGGKGKKAAAEDSDDSDDTTPLSSPPESPAHTNRLQSEDIPSPSSAPVTAPTDEGGARCSLRTTKGTGGKSARDKEFGDMQCDNNLPNRARSASVIDQNVAAFIKGDDKQQAAAVSLTNPPRSIRAPLNLLQIIEASKREEQRSKGATDDAQEKCGSSDEAEPASNMVRVPLKHQFSVLIASSLKSLLLKSPTHPQLLRQTRVRGLVFDRGLLLHSHQRRTKIPLW